MNTTVPATLRRLRQQAGLSLKDVAGRLDVHFTTVSAWERGRSEPSLERLRELAQVYGVELGGLVGGSPGASMARGFRPISPLAGERLLSDLEELRLAVCLGRALAAEGGAEKLAATTGIPGGRLLELAAGEGIPRPAELAALVRELGSPGVHELDAGKDSEVPPELPPELAAAVQRLLDRLRSYLAGLSGRQ